MLERKYEDDNDDDALSATNFVGAGSGITGLNASNIASGTLSIARGGIGVTTLTTEQILIGNAATSILQSANLTWNNTSNTLSATNFVGAGSGITSLNYNNISTNKPDLSVYAIKSNVDSSLNTINSTLATKENALTFSTPLTRTTNTVGIDLSGYPLKTYVDGSLNTINSTLSTKPI
jgi:apolipoprotein N-acyltransferase